METKRYYKVRKVAQTIGGKSNYAITIPREMVAQFEETRFVCSVQGDRIVFESGCPTQ